jgi:chlorite dismutase
MASEPGYERIEGLPVGQYVTYRFFRVDPAWRRLPAEERAAGKDGFAEVVEQWAERMEGLHAYSVTGVRREADFFLWQITERWDDLIELGAALNGTPLAGWLETPHSYVATTKPSNYTDKKRVRQGKVIPRGAPYLVVYPFVKLRPWYFLTFDERRDAMREHAEVGGKFVTVTNHTTYSFGLDDQEFMPAFECDEPADFMHLMMTLRETEASRWTERDTPIFVGRKVDIRTALDALDGVVTLAEHTSPAASAPAPS